jgi:hypothetical protein
MCRLPLVVHSVHQPIRFPFQAIVVIVPNLCCMNVARGETFAEDVSRVLSRDDTSVPWDACASSWLVTPGVVKYLPALAKRPSVAAGGANSTIDATTFDAALKDVAAVS